MTRILVADDSVGVRNSLRTLLTNSENWVICGEAANGEQAVRLAQELKPDLIVMDFAMPVLDGLAAAAEILKFLPSVPIVLFTLHMSQHLERMAKTIGIRRVISKGDTTKALLQNLREVLEECGTPNSPLAPNSDPQTESSPRPTATNGGSPGC